MSLRLLLNSYNYLSDTKMDDESANLPYEAQRTFVAPEPFQVASYFPYNRSTVPRRGIILATVTA